MRSSLALAGAFVVSAAMLSTSGTESPRCAGATPSAPTSAAGRQLLGRLPVSFVPNRGQWDHSANFVARFGAMTVFLEQNGWTFTLVERTTGPQRPTDPWQPRAPRDDVQRGVGVRMTFLGANESELVAEDQLPGRHNYFLGNDASKWRSDVPLYGAVRYREMHRGIDVRAREQDGHFEYDLLLQPDADLDLVEIDVQGIDGMRVDANGALLLETSLGPVHMPTPLTWEEGSAGEKRLITCRYVLHGQHRFGFEVPGRRPGWALVVDPGLVWSTFLGAMPSETAHAVALAQDGVVIAGNARSQTFPTTPGAFDTSYNGGTFGDAFVAKLSSSGSTLVYSTFLGGTGSDSAIAIALDALGAVTVTGDTGSTDFPTTLGAFDTSYNGGVLDGFVSRLSADGATLVYSTFIGGPSQDGSGNVSVDATGAATVAGYSSSSTFPTTPGAFDTSYNGSVPGDPIGDGFVARLAPDGSSLLYSTFLGGTSIDWVGGLHVDAQGAATIVGSTRSTDFPATPGAFDTSYNGGGDAFVARLSPTGATLVYATFFGGSGSDWAGSVELDRQGAPTIAGNTASSNLPTTPGAYDTSYNGGTWGDAYVARFTSSGTGLVYSTYLGGSAGENAYALTLDARGAATIGGDTSSADFPTTPGAFDATISAGPGDAFVARLSPTGSSLVYSTYLGGTGEDIVGAIALDSLGVATAVGRTASAGFPTTPGVFDPTFNSFTEGDAFVTRLDMLPTGVAAFGDSSPGCTGSLPISVNSMPFVGNAAFALTCGNAPLSSVGLVAFSGAALLAPVAVLGIDVWVDPIQLLATPTVVSDAIGNCDAPLPIPSILALAGLRLFAQFVWLGPTAPPPCPPQGFSASNALDLTIQP